MRSRVKLLHGCNCLAALYGIISLSYCFRKGPYLIYGVRNVGIRKMDLNGDNPTTLIPSAVCANDFDYDIR